MTNPKIINLDEVKLDHLILDGDTGKYSSDFLKRRTISDQLLKECGFDAIPDYRAIMGTKNALDAYNRLKLKLHITKLVVENYLQETNEKIVILTEKYKHEKFNEMLEDFWVVNFEFTNDENDKIAFADVYSVFKSYYCDKYNNRNYINAEEFKQYLLDKTPTYDPDINSVTNYKYKTNDINGLLL